MPQLDKVTFFSQFFWLSFFYLAFYLILFKSFLPALSRLFKFRQKKMTFSQQGVATLQQEESRVSKSLEGFVERVAATSKSLFQQNLQQIQLWLENSMTTTNRADWKTTNQVYILSLGKKNVSQGLPLYLTFLIFSDKLALSLVANNIALGQGEVLSSKQV